MLSHLSIIYGYFHATMAEVNSYDRVQMAHKTRSIYYLAYQRKKFADPWSGRFGPYQRVNEITIRNF